MATKRPDRVLYPVTGFTAHDAVEYYRRVATVLLPHLRNVPLSFKRYPDTVRGESFWEKDAPSFTPAWVHTVAVPRRTGEADIRYIVADNRRTLLWLAESGAIELHPFLHRAPKIDIATSVVFDLDPRGELPAPKVRSLVHRPRPRRRMDPREDRSATAASIVVTNSSSPTVDHRPQFELANRGLWSVV